MEPSTPADSPVEISPATRKIIEAKCLRVLALPGNRIRGFRVDTIGGQDTAFYRLDNGEIYLSPQLVHSIEKHAPKNIPGTIAAVLHHEAYHSIATRFGFDGFSPSQIYLVNHIEDVRINQAAVEFDPKLSFDYQDLLRVVTAQRVGAAEPPIKSTQERICRELMDFFTKVNFISYSPKLRPKIEVMAINKAYHADTRGALKDVLPHYIKFIQQRPDYFDRMNNDKRADVAYQELKKIFERIDPYFDFKHEPNSMKEMEQAVKEQEQENKKQQQQSGQGQPQKPKDNQGQSGKPQEGKGGQPDKNGQPQGGKGDDKSQGESKDKSQDGSSGKEENKDKSSGSDKGESKEGGGKEESKDKASGSGGKEESKEKEGQGEGMSPGSHGGKDAQRERIERYKKMLKELKDMPHKGENPHETDNTVERKAREIAEKGKGGSGLTHAEKLDKTSEHDLADLEIYNKFYTANYSLVNGVRRAFANVNPSSTEDGTLTVEPSQTGTRVNVRNLRRMMHHKPPELPPLFQRSISEESTQNPIEWKLDKMYFAVDGSGSMDSRAQYVRFMLGVIFEAARQAKIPSGIVVAYGGRPTVLSKGNGSDKAEEVIRKILNFTPSGGTNLSQGALETIIETAGATSANRGRLVLVTDCEIDPSDADLLRTYSKKFSYPAAVMGIGSSGAMHNVKNWLKDIPVIGLDINTREPDLILKYLSEFSAWMRNPEDYTRKYPQGRLLSEFKDQIGKSPIKLPSSFSIDLE